MKTSRQEIGSLSGVMLEAGHINKAFQLRITENIPNKISIRYIICIPSNPKNEVLSKAKWYSLPYLNKKRLACIAHQAYYNLAPPDITNLFSKHVTKCNLSGNLTFDLTHSYWKGLNDSFTHGASIIWNALPVKIKSSHSLASFKADISKHSKSIDGILLGRQSQTKVVGRVVNFNSSPF